jgi:hypothetical protein
VLSGFRVILVHHRPPNSPGSPNPPAKREPTRNVSRSNLTSRAAIARWTLVSGSTALKPPGAYWGQQPSAPAVTKSSCVTGLNRVAHGKMPATSEAAWRRPSEGDRSRGGPDAFTPAAPQQLPTGDRAAVQAVWRSCGGRVENPSCGDRVENPSCGGQVENDAIGFPDVPRAVAVVRDAAAVDSLRDRVRAYVLREQAASAGPIMTSGAASSRSGSGAGVRPARRGYGTASSRS